jgi:hypothetical protein
MKCPHCGAEVQEGDTFCGECGTKLPIPTGRIEENKYWKWGSMIASLVLVFIWWSFVYSVWIRIPSSQLLSLLAWLIFAFPASIYLMYKERTEKIKYGLAWILFPLILVFYVVVFKNTFPILFFYYAVPAIVIDFLYVFTTLPEMDIKFLR